MSFESALDGASRRLRLRPPRASPLPKQALSIKGTLKTYADQGDSGKAVNRRFCPDCGSPIITEAEALPDLVIIKAGTLDDTSWLKPTTEIYCDRAQPGVQLGGGMQRFP